MHGCASFRFKCRAGFCHVRCLALSTQIGFGRFARHLFGGKFRRRGLGDFGIQRKLFLTQPCNFLFRHEPCRRSLAHPVFDRGQFTRGGLLRYGFFLRGEQRLIFRLLGIQTRAQNLSGTCIRLRAFSGGIGRMKRRLRARLTRTLDRKSTRLNSSH